MVRFPRVNAAMNSVKFNEDSRVKVPVVLQLLRLGYSFLSRDEWEKQREPRTNILRDVFAEAYVKLNAGKNEADARHYISIPCWCRCWTMMIWGGSFIGNWKHKTQAR